MLGLTFERANVAVELRMPLRIVDLVENEGARCKSLGDPWADTTTPHGRLSLTVLGGIAEFERSLIL